MITYNCKISIVWYTRNLKAFFNVNFFGTLNWPHGPHHLEEYRIETDDHLSVVSSMIVDGYSQTVTHTAQYKKKLLLNWAFHPRPMMARERP